MRRLLFFLLIISNLAAVVQADETNQLRWKEASNGHTPVHSVIGGYALTGKPYYICRAAFKDGEYPGKVMGRHCRFTYNGTEVMTPRYQVLVTARPIHWVPALNGEIPDNAIVGGEHNNHPLFICQAKYAGGILPGKLTGKRCHVSDSGKDIKRDEYNVLVG